MSINIEKSRKLALVVDMYGCPNRCRHCWLGRLPNIPPENGADEMPGEQEYHISSVPFFFL